MFQLKSKSTHGISNENISSGLIIPQSNGKRSGSMSSMLEKYSNLNLSVESINSLDSLERRDSATSDITANESKDNILLKAANSSCLNPEYKLKQASGVITAVEQIDPVDSNDDALTFYEAFNSKLKSLGDKIYLLNVDNLIELLNFQFSQANELDNNLFPYLHGLSNSKLRVFFNKKFANVDDENINFGKLKHLDVQHFPDTKQLHLMILNTQETCGFKLNNSIPIEEFTEALNEFHNDPNELNNRNFGGQLRLYSRLSHFIVYNNKNNLNVNLNKALELKTTNNIYVVNFNNRYWDLVPSRFLEESNFEQVHQLPINSINNETFNCLLLKWEQNLLWKYNSMKWLNKNVCVGNLIDYNYLQSVKHDFKLIINCSEYSVISPEIHSYTEFPSSGYLHFERLNLADLINFLNLLKTIKSLYDSNKKVFIFSFDGFTGLSLLTLAVGMMISGMGLEQMLLDIYASKSMKLYFFKSDMICLKKFEKFINYARDCEGPVRFINYNELKPLRMIEHDWFDYNKDNNFPCNISKNLFLGSLNHANSRTILNCMRFNKIVSVGEKPSWLNLLNQRPVYRFTNELGKTINIYDIKVDDERCPHLTSVLYIENLRDDGKDEILPLLLKTPEHIQSKYIQNPSSSIKTLYHCKIGVSRLASLVIASLMKYQKLSLIESNMLTRINRFNIIIQPNLRIFYDLYLYDNHLNNLRNSHTTHSWYYLCNEIDKLNKNYIS